MPILSSVQRGVTYAQRKYVQQTEGKQKPGLAPSPPTRLDNTGLPTPLSPKEMNKENIGKQNAL